MIKRFVRFIKYFSRKDKFSFAMITLLMSLAGIMESAGIGVLLAAVTVFLKPQGEFFSRIKNSISGIFPGMSEQSFLIAGALTVVLILVLKNLFSLYIVHLQSKFIRTKQYELAGRLCRVYLYADGKFFNTMPTGECNGNIQRIFRICDSFLLPAMQLIADSAVIFFLALTAVLIMPLVTLCGSAFVLLASWGISALFRKMNLRLSKKLCSCEVEENRRRLETFMGIGQIKCAGSEELFLKRFTEAQKDYAGQLAKIYTVGQIPRFALETVAMLMAAGLFVILLVSGNGKEEILLTFTVIIASLSRILPSLSRAHYSFTSCRQYGGIFDMIFDEMENVPAEKHHPEGIVPEALQDIILEDVSFSYGSGKNIFENFSMTIPARQTTGIVGRSGRGKTTLINLIMGFLSPDKGRILAGTTPIDSNISAWRKQIGYVPQQVFIFNTTVRENVAFGVEPQDIDDEKVKEALRMAQLPEFAENTGLIMEGQGNTVSGGQRQRIGIARALYRDPELLILDEATSALDSNTENELCAALETLHNRLTIVVISHRQSTLANCDKIVEL